RFCVNMTTPWQVPCPSAIRSTIIDYQIEADSCNRHCLSLATHETLTALCEMLYLLRPTRNYYGQYSGGINTMSRFQGMSDADKLNDIQILNRALFFENRGVWAYSFAGGKLSTSQVGKTVLELGLQNRADHEKHQDMLRNAISELGGTPVQMEKNYDLSSYINKGQGNVDNDVNIAKLALALEIGAAVGYVSDTTKLKSPYMIELEAGIACIEAIHAARIRAAFNALGIKIPVVPSALISTSDRDTWVIKVD